MIRAADIHAQVDWPAILAQLGIPEESLRLKKAGPCPACGGRDRFTFDNRKGRGDFICRVCGAGDGFELLTRVNRWSFSEARRHVLEAAGISRQEPAAPLRAPIAHLPPAAPSARVLSIARSACSVADCPDAVSYLESRGLWPMPGTLKAHAGIDYYDGGNRIGRYPALVGEVRDVAGEFVTVHVTYLANGRKLEGHEPRKILSKTEGREGCAVRLMPAGDVLGIAEGIETALSAAALEGVPVWAALNTALLAKFEPPAGVTLLRIYADNDAPGLLAAGRLMERLQGRLRLELRVPTGHKDFNETLQSRSGGEGLTHG